MRSGGPRSDRTSTSQARADRPPRAADTLARILGWRAVVLITVSAVTPAASVLVIAPAAITALGGASLFAFLGGALLCLGCAMCYAELASAFPLAGGEYSYAARVLGAGAGSAVLGSSVVSVVLVVGSLSAGAGDLVAAATGTVPSQLVASAVVVAGTVVASLRVTVGARLTAAFLALEVGTLSVVSLLGLVHVARPLSEVVTTSPVAPGATVAFAVAVVAQLPTAVFAYNGYASGVFLTEDMRTPARTAPTMIYTSLVVTVVIELVPLVALLVGAPSLEAMVADPSPLAYFLSARGGPNAAAWLLPAIALAIANAVIAILMQASRLVFTAARDGALVRPVNAPLAQLDRRTGAPARAAVMVGLLALLSLVLVPPDALLTLTASSILVAGAAVATCSLVGRRRGVTGAGAHRMPAWPVPPLVTLVTTVGIAAAQWRADEARILAPLGVLLLAFAVGVVRQRGRV